MRHLILPLLLTAMLTGPAAVGSAAQDTEEPSKRRLPVVRMLAVTLDAQAARRFPDWLRDYGSAREFTIRLLPDDQGFLVFTLNGDDATIYGDNGFDTGRFAVEFYSHGKDRDGVADRMEALAGSFSGYFRDKAGVTVSPSFRVRRAPDGQRLVCELDISLKEGAGERFLDRLRAFARKYDYVAIGGATPSNYVSFFFMAGKTVGIYGSTSAIPPDDRDRLNAGPEEPVTYNPLEYEVTCYRNGPPESSTDEEVARKVNQFTDFIGQVEGVTVSERGRK
jgi:hypothetical protein